MNPISPHENVQNSVGHDEEMLGAEDEDEAIMRAVDEAEKAEDPIEGDRSPDKEEFETSDEAVVPRQLRRPNQPTQKQIDEHRQASHIPYRSWCRWCVEGRGLHDQHPSGMELDKLDKCIPCVSMDYLFMGDKKTAAEHNPILGTYDNGTDTIKVYVTKKKGAVVWLPRAINSDLESLGYGGCRVSIKTDQEKSVMAVKRAVADERSAPTAMLESPVRESQCNGKMEKAVQKWQGQLRTLKLALEDNIGSKINVKSKIFEWLSYWAAESLNRYLVGADGKTAFARVTGTQCSRTIAEFGEQILYKR